MEQNNPAPRDVLKHLVIAGIIGAGKSVLARRLGVELGIQTYYESIPDVKLLQDFYQDQAKYAFELQMYLLETRARQHLKASVNHGVEDRCIFEDQVFVNMLYHQGKLTEGQYKICRSMQKLVYEKLTPPTILIYLDVKPETALARIAERNRSYEQNIELGYLQDLKDHYSSWLEMLPTELPGVRIIKVCWEEFPDDKSLKALTEKLAELISTPRLPETLVI